MSAVAARPPATSSAALDSSKQEAPPAGRVRLHIKPFNPDLLKTYVPTAFLSRATNISYHASETSPEKGFGYIELPAMEAQKLKQKLNGSTLKGHKVKITDAKPEKRKIQAEAEESDEESRRHKKRRMKEKRKEGVLPAIELPASRKVKRGWTESASEKKVKDKSKKNTVKEKEKEKEKKRKEKGKREASKYTSEPELLFRTKLPPNVAAGAADAKPKKKDLDKKKSKKSEREVTVHEFSKTRKHAAFLKDNTVTSGIQAREYVDGQGWVDDEGNVVESEKLNKRYVIAQKSPEASSTTLEGDLIDDQKSSSDEEEEATPKPSKGKAKAAVSSTNTSTNTKAADMEDEDDSDSSSVLSSSSALTSSSDESESSEVPTQALGETTQESEVEAPADIAPSITATTPNEVHPLEALFKRPKPSTSSPKGDAAKLAPIKTSFSFFDAEGDEEEEEQRDEVMVDIPATPFTKQDREWRGLRSAAPTPDTAAVGKKFSFPWKDEDEDDEEEQEEKQEDEEEDEPYEGPSSPTNANRSHKFAADAASGEKEESDFAKWFWENRGETNRAWKQRRREALKTKRQRENRKLSRRMV